jgi:hypothetical protein
MGRSVTLCCWLGLVFGWRSDGCYLCGRFGRRTRARLVGPAAPPRRGWVLCTLLRGQAAAPTGMVRTCWVLVGPASEPSSSSRRRGSILGFKKAGFSLLCGNDGEKDPGLVGPATPPGRVWAPCILHRGQATAPTWGFALDHHLGRTGGPAGKGLELGAFCFAVRRPLPPGDLRWSKWIPAFAGMTVWGVRGDDGVGVRGNDGVGVRGSDGVGGRGNDESGIKKGTSEDVP